MSWKMKFITLIFAIVFPLLAQASTHKEYLDFFQKYELLGDTFDNAVADMYSDEAKVSVLEVLEGTETTTKMNGKKVKKMIHEQMELIKKMDSKNDLSKISVEIEGNKATIKATRYSTFKCFTDNKNFMVVKKQADGTLQIIEEFMEEPIKTHCKEMSDKQLAFVLESMVVATKSHVPVMVDSETRLEKTSAEGKTFTYHYTLVNFMSNMIGSEQFKASMTPNIVKQMCNNTTMRSYMDMGAILEHSYKSKDQLPITAMQVVKTDCKPSDYGM